MPQRSPEPSPGRGRAAWAYAHCDPRYPQLRRLLELGEARGRWEGAAPRQFRAREQIFVAGEPADAVFLLLRGRARVYGISAAGRTVTFWLARPGEFLGLAEVLGNANRRAYAEAREELAALRLPRSYFCELVQADREISQIVLAQLGRRLRVSCETTLAVATAPVMGRLCRVLLLLFAGAGPGDQVPGAGAERYSQQELAEMIGTSRQSVNEALMELRATGAIDMRNGRILLRSRAALIAAEERS